MSFVRSDSLRLNRRRYELTLDSWFLIYQPYQELQSSDSTDDENNEIIYYHSYSNMFTDRPYNPRLELEMQLTFQFRRIPNRKQVQMVHILSAVQLVGYLVQEGCDTVPTEYNPIREDLPLILHRPENLRHFDGTSIVHFVFRQIYQCLVHINPMGKCDPELIVIIS